MNMTERKWPASRANQANTMIRLLIASGLLLWFPCNWAEARKSSQDIASTIEAKVALESSLEKRIYSVLTEILGTERLIVIINVELLTKEEEKGPSEEIMPGVPLRETPATQAALTSALTMVKKLSATIIVDKATSKEDIDLLKKVTQGLLGLVPDRGDKLIVEKMVFQKATPFSFRQILVPPDLWKALWVLLASAAIAVLLGTFLRPLLSRFADLASAVRSQGEAARAAAEESMFRAPAAAGGPGAAAGEAAAPAETDHKESLPFGFLREYHLQNLIHILRNAPFSIGATVIHYLPPGMASRVLSSLGGPLRSEVTLHLSKVTELPQSKVSEIENWVKSRVDFLIGGEERLVDLLGKSPSNVQEEIIKDVSSKDPDLAKRLSRRIVRLEDLAKLEAVDIQNVLRRVPMPTMAQVLKADEDLAKAILEKIPAGLSGRLSQEMEFARPMSKEKLEGEKMRVVDVLKQMIREGWIFLRKE